MLYIIFTCETLSDTKRLRLRLKLFLTRNETKKVLLKSALYVVQLLSITYIGCDTCLDKYCSISNVKGKKLLCR